MLEKTNCSNRLNPRNRVLEPTMARHLELYQPTPSSHKKGQVESKPVLRTYRQEISSANCEESQQWESERQESSAQALHPRQQAALAALLFRKGLLTQLVHSAALSER